MIRRTDVSEPLLRLADAQSHVVTREQSVALGVSDTVLRRLVRSGAWQPLGGSVYAVHSGPLGWETLAWAGVLQGGEDAVLAGDAAAFLWGLRAVPPEQILVELPHGDNARRSTPPWLFRRTRHPSRGHGSPPRKPAAETVVDLLIAHPDRRARILADADHHKINFRAILAVLDALPRVPDRRLIEAMLGRAREGIHSELEQIYARDVERAHGLPKGVRQFYDGKYRTDVRYGPLIVELDGRAGHEGEGVFRDMERDNDHVLAGELTLRYGFDDCHGRPCEVARQVARVLTQLGWPGPLENCRNCRALAY